MSEETPILNNAKHTVSFTRKVNLGYYESQEATFFLQFDTPQGASFEDIIAKAGEAFVSCKGVVLTQLGISYDLNEEGVLVEDRPTPPAPDAITTVRNAFGGGEASTDNTVREVNFSHGSSVDPTTLGKAEQKKWLQDEFRANPGAFYDNRAKKASGDYKQTSPDLKHKESGLGLWLK